MVHWIPTESQWEVRRKSNEKCTRLKYQNSYEYLTEADFYSNSHFYREWLAGMLPFRGIHIHIYNYYKIMMGTVCSGLDCTWGVHTGVEQLSSDTLLGWWWHCGKCCTALAVVIVTWHWLWTHMHGLGTNWGGDHCRGQTTQHVSSMSMRLSRNGWCCTSWGHRGATRVWWEW